MPRQVSYNHYSVYVSYVYYFIVHKNHYFISKLYTPLLQTNPILLMVARTSTGLLPAGNHCFSFSLVKNKNTFFLSSGYSTKSEPFPHIFLTGKISHLFETVTHDVTIRSKTIMGNGSPTDYNGAENPITHAVRSCHQKVRA